MPSRFTVTAWVDAGSGRARLACGLIVAAGLALCLPVRSGHAAELDYRLPAQTPSFPANSAPPASEDKAPPDAEARAPADTEAPKTADGDKLDTVIVEGKKYFLESDRQMEKVINKLPGADDPVAVKKTLGQKVMKHFDDRRDPNALKPDDQQALLRTAHGGEDPPR